MKENNKNIKFGKSLNNNSVDEKSNQMEKDYHEGQRQRIINKLIEKYDITEQEAEAVLVRLENREKEVNDKLPDQPAEVKDTNVEVQKKPSKKVTPSAIDVEDKGVIDEKVDAKPSKKVTPSAIDVEDKGVIDEKVDAKPLKRLKTNVNDSEVDVIIPQHVLDRQKEDSKQKKDSTDSKKINEIVPEISDVEPQKKVDSDVSPDDDSLQKDEVATKVDSLKKAAVASKDDAVSPEVDSLQKDDGAATKVSSLKKAAVASKEEEVAKPGSLKKAVVDSKEEDSQKSRKTSKFSSLKKAVSVPKLNPLKKSSDDSNVVAEDDNLKDEDTATDNLPIDDSKEDSSDVDAIMSDIIPGFDSEISIELNNVDLTFDVATDRIDTLKESVIRTIKRNKSKKIKFKALKDISFKIYQGEKVGIIGYNGAGKSTLLKVITGIYPPDTGKVVTYGNISPLLSLGAGFDRNYSGRKNIYLNGAVLGYSKKFLQEREAEIIEFSELGEFIDFPIRNYSSGMIAKLGFSIATMVDPDILIIDEILSVGDVNFKRKSSDKIKSLMDGKTTVLLVSHSIPQIRSLCDRAIWIDKGEVREIGDVNDVCNHYLKDSEKASKEQLKNIQFR